jgi:hypothetical protein
LLSVIGFVLLASSGWCWTEAQSTLYVNRPAFEAATGATSVPIPPSSTYSNPFVYVDAGCTSSLTGIGVPNAAPVVTATAPNASLICIIGPLWNAPLSNTNPKPLSPTLVGNGEDDYLLTFNMAVDSVGLELLTNFTADHTITLTYSDGTTETFVDAVLQTGPNTFEFVGFASSKPIQSVFVDTVDGSVQNEGLSAILVAAGKVSAYCTAGTSASGCRATLSAVGTASATAATGFVLLSSSVEGSSYGTFFYGTNGRLAVPWGTGTSYECVAPPTVRANVLHGGGHPGNCDGTYVQDLNAYWASVPGSNPGPGAIVKAQLIYRDPLSTSNQGTSLSDAIEFLVGP